MKTAYTAEEIIVLLKEDYTPEELGGERSTGIFSFDSMEESLSPNVGASFRSVLEMVANALLRRAIRDYGTVAGNKSGEAKVFSTRKGYCFKVVVLGAKFKLATCKEHWELVYMSDSQMDLWKSMVAPGTVKELLRLFLDLKITDKIYAYHQESALVTLEEDKLLERSLYRIDRKTRGDLQKKLDQFLLNGGVSRKSVTKAEKKHLMKAFMKALSRFPTLESTSEEVSEIAADAVKKALIQRTLKS